MKKTFIVAQSEFVTLVRSKAFIISVILMPVVMAGSALLIRATKDAPDDRDRQFAFVDYTGVLAGPLREAAGEWNSSTSPRGNAVRTTPRFVPQEISPKGRDPESLRLELSERVSRGDDLFAFVELPAALIDPAAHAEIRYYSDHPSYTALSTWIESTTNRLVFNERFRTAAVDQALVTRLTSPVELNTLGLLTRDEQGRVKDAEKVDQVRAFVVPAIMMFLLYVTVMSSAPQLLNSVIEEKMSRISEVLIGSVSPFQLMAGKLIGSVAVSVLLAAVYLAGGLVGAQRWGYAGSVTPALIAWFLLFMVLAVLLFGSMFIAIGAACTDLKDSQGMMTPVMLLVMLPMFTWMAVLRAPDSLFATVMSLVPTATPFLMMLRISLRPGPPAWQIALSVAIVGAAVSLIVWAAGKIFRTGLLMQGKSASVAEMVRWVRAR